MKKLLGILVLGLLWCNVGFAGWKKVAIPINNNGAIYVDTQSVKKIGNKVIFLQLNSYTTPLDTGQVSWYSDIAKTEVDCTNNKLRELSITFYEKKMGKGEVIMSSDKVSDWYVSEPGSIQLSAVKYVCK